MAVRHFLTLHDLSKMELRQLLRRASELKAQHQRGELYQPLNGKVMGMIFEKSSTRTRVSFEAAMAQFGGHAIFLSSRDSQLGRGEPIEDTARVLSRMVDVIMIRTYAHEQVERFAAHSNVPVINALTDAYHPCQLIADMQTFAEHRGEIAGKTIAWVGDGNNMCNSYIEAALQFDFQLHITTPPGYEPDKQFLAHAGDQVRMFDNPLEAVRDVDLVTTDVWASMGMEEEKRQRQRDFAAWQVDDNIMAAAKPDALFLHCLPAHRGEEVAASVIDGPNSQVWDQAENRLHAQKALLELLLL